MPGKAKKRKRAETLDEKAQKERKEHRSEEKQSEKFRNEEWMILEPSQWAFKRCVDDVAAQPSPFTFPRNVRTTHLQVFRQMWPLLQTIPVTHATSKNNLLKSQRNYFFFLAIRIYIHAVNTTENRKANLKSFWDDDQFIQKFSFVAQKLCLPYKYRKWSVMFTHFIAKVDDWYELCNAWSTAIVLGESFAADEKNLKTRCRTNPLVSMVKEKTNAVIGIWFFQIACNLKETNQPYLFALRPAKAMRGDKSLDVWAEWVKRFLPTALDLTKSIGLSVSDSFYASEASLQSFDAAQQPFLIGLKSNNFSYVQKKLSKIVKMPGDWSMAWSSQLGRVIVCVWEHDKKSRKSCISNAYKLVKHTIPLSDNTITKENLLDYMFGGKRPNMEPAIVRAKPLSDPPNQPSNPPLNPQLTPIESCLPLPKGWYEISCPHCDCGKRFYIQIRKGVHTKIARPPPTTQQINKEKKATQEKKKEKEKEEEKEEEKTNQATHANLRGNLKYPPMPWMDYNSAFKCCDEFNSLCFLNRWIYQRKGTRIEEKDHSPGGWQLVVDMYYFTCALINSWVLFENLQSKDCVGSFDEFCFGLVDEIIKELSS